MKLRRFLLAAFVLILFGAPRVHAQATFTSSSITYCIGATADAIAPGSNGGYSNTSVIIYTAAPWWYLTIADAAPGLTAGYYPGIALPGTQALWHMDTINGSGGSATSPDALGLHNLSPVFDSINSGTAGCQDGSSAPAANPPTVVAGQANFGNALQYTGANATCCTGYYNGNCTGTQPIYSVADSQIPSFDNMFTSASFSVELWVNSPGTMGGANPNASNDYLPILEQCQAATLDRCLHMVIHSGGPYFGFFSDNMPNNNVTCAGPSGGWNGWHHLAFTFDGPNLTKSIYVDGVLSCQGSSTHMYWGTSGTTYLGAAPSVSPGNSLRGQIDEVRVFNSAIPGGQVASDYVGQAEYYSNGQTGGWQPFLLSYHQSGLSHNSLSANVGIHYSGLSTAGSASNVMEFAVEDQTANLPQYASMNVTVDQSDLALVQPITTPSVGYSSITWDWSSYLCNTCGGTTGNNPPCSSTPGNNTTYTITTNAGTPSASSTPNYSVVDGLPINGSSPIIPNSLYYLNAVATYVDNDGGSGKAVGPSGAGTAASVWTLAAPPAAGPTLVSTGPASVILNLNVSPNPPGYIASNNNNATECQVWGIQNGILGQLSNYNWVFPSSGTISTFTALGKSSNYNFKVSCENQQQIPALPGPASLANPSYTPANGYSYVSQPATPTGFGGNAPSDAPMHCPKNSINWSWTPVLAGSSANPRTSSNTEYKVSQMNSGAVGPVTCTPNNGVASCLESGLTPGVGYSRVVQAGDPGDPYWSWSDTSTTIGVLTSGNYTGAPTNLTATPGPTVNSIVWNWNLPPNVCESFQYNVYDARTGQAFPIAPPGPCTSGQIGDKTAPYNPNSPGALGSPGYPNPTWTQNCDVTNTQLAINSLYSIAVTATDDVTPSASPLSAAATAYTLANQPSNLAAAVVSTTSVLLEWQTNNNPSYTRYEVSMSSVVNSLSQMVSISTLTYISNDWTASSLAVYGLNPGTTYYFRVRAANGRASDNYGGIMTGFAYLTSGSTITWPQSPTLSGTGMSSTTVSWSWNYVTGATGYKLVSDANVTILDNPNTFQASVSSGPYTANTVCGAKVAAYNSNGTAGGLGPFSSPVYTFTFATTPVITAGLGIVGVTSNTVNLAWSPNGNTSYTYYEVSLATDSAFGVVAATVSVMSTSTVIGGLFPGATYYARLQAINGSQSMTSFVTAGSTCTNSDSSVTRSSVPASAYGVPPGTVGLWHLDEGSGTVAYDASAWASTGELTCQDITSYCSAPTSTPTFTTNALPGLGTAVSFSGQRNSLLLIQDEPQYDFTGSLTVSAWVQPAALSQSDGAGLVTKGAWGQESFSLEIETEPYNSPRYLFRVQLNDGGVPVALTVVGTSTIRAGQWDLVTGVFDQADSSATLYIDGVFAASATANWPTRWTNAEPIAVGNHLNVAGSNYTLGFSGIIDDIRLVSGALNAAGAASLYKSYFTSQLTPPGVNSSIQLTLPPNAFPSAATIYISSDPVNHPLRISSSLLSQALLRVPTGQVLLTPSQSYPSLVEIVPTLDGVNYYNGPLGSSAVLSMPYADVNGVGIIDGSNPPVSVSKLQFYTLDPSVMAWNPLTTAIDTVNKRVSAIVPHFSIFGIFGATAYGQTPSTLMVYPVPWKVNSSDKFGGAYLYFAGLPTSGTIRILNFSGEKVIDLAFSGTNNGTLQWDGYNTSGKMVASGVYFARIKSSVDGSSRILKFAIEK